MASEQISLDRIAGMIIGAATGDALGAPSEFKYNRNIMPYTGWIIYAPRLLIRMQGYHTAVVGQPTDDTEMSLTLLRSLIDNNGYQPKLIVKDYLNWAYHKPFTYLDSSGNIHSKNTRPFGMGINTKSLFGQIKTVNGYVKRYRKKFNQDPLLELEQSSQYNRLNLQSTEVRSNQGNGSLMRLYPLALLPDGIREQATIIDCQLTNPSIVNLDCSLYAVRVLRTLLLGESATNALHKAGQHIYHSYEIIETVQQALRKEKRDISSGGWVLHALYIAIRSLIEFDRYDLAMDWIIKLGGDTDTNAAIAGAWLGASIGYQNLLSEGETYYINSEGIIQDDYSPSYTTTTRNAYNFNRVLNVTTLDGDYPRPKQYRLQDFHELIQKIERRNF